MPSTELATIDRERWEIIQRMAAAFCKSDLVPDQMRDSVANCTVALLMAEQMHENPLMVMQNIYFVHGRPGWITQFMVSKANQSGKFRGPLRFKIEGEGDALAVTCYGNLRDAPDDDCRVERTVSLATAKEMGWTTYKKDNRILVHPRWAVRAMQEQMLCWRSAAWLIRLYTPEVMFGLPMAEELEDGREPMKDVTPPRPTMDDFKPSGVRAETEPSAADGAGAAVDDGPPALQGRPRATPPSAPQRAAPTPEPVGEPALKSKGEGEGEAGEPLAPARVTEPPGGPAPAQAAGGSDRVSPESSAAEPTGAEPGETAPTAAGATVPPAPAAPMRTPGSFATMIDILGGMQSESAVLGLEAKNKRSIAAWPQPFRAQWNAAVDAKLDELRAKNA